MATGTFLPYGLFLCVVMFISTSAKTFPKDLSAVKLPHSVVLDEDEKFHLWWDFDEEKVVFEVRVKTLGYVGLGLSPNGGMTGADVIMGGVSDVDGKVFFEDRHATGEWEPISDTSQDWKLITGSQNDTHTVLRFWRKLQTCDKQDRPITADTTRVIWAYKDTDLSESSGSLYHGTHHRGSKSIFLLNPQSVRPEMPKDAITMEFRNNDLMVPANDTVYWCQAFSTHQFSTKHHAIKFEPVISKGNEGVVHHFVLYACPLETTNETAGITGRCYDTSVPVEWRRCLTSIYAWAIGGGPFYLPEHVGYPFGSEGDPKLVLLETHFDNPDKRSDIVDSSGLRLTLTPSLRQHDAGTLVVGMTSSPSQVIPPFADDFRIDGHCVPECLAKGMAPRSSIKVFAGFLHAHLLGVAIKFRHFRKGVELQPIIKDDNYDFNFQETRMLQKEVEIQAGDHLISECHYSSIQRNKVTFGGFSTRDEMCETFALYYPKISLAGCYTGVDGNTTADFANVTIFANYTVRDPENSQGESLSDVIMDRIDWSDESTRARYQGEATSYDNHVISYCSQNVVTTFPFVQQVKLPRIQKAYVAHDKCMMPFESTKDSRNPNKASSVTYGYVVIVSAVLLWYLHGEL